MEKEFKKDGVLFSEYIQVDDKIYSAKLLAQHHPGGAYFVKPFSGYDATDAFISYHRRKFPHDKMEFAKVGAAQPERPLGSNANYLELCKIINDCLPIHKSWAPFSFFIKIGVLLSLIVGIEAYMHVTGHYSILLSCLLGYFSILGGFNIQHDANHGSFSRAPWVNKLFGLYWNYVGGSASNWIYWHDVQHHLYSNDVKKDPDNAPPPFILRFNPSMPLLSIHSFQYIYWLAFNTMFAFSFYIRGIVFSLTGWDHSYCQNHDFSDKIIDVISSMLFIFRFFVLPYLRTGKLSTILLVIPYHLVVGGYFSFFALLNHNYDGVHFYDDSAEFKDSDVSKIDYNSFLYRQVTASSNFGYETWCFLHGGLNYQIEHHLFPRIHHAHYPRIAPLVRQYCAVKGIPYKHFPTVWENFVSTVKHFYKMGNHVTDVKINRKITENKF
jgi:fatty acid desaturase (delta-4 desaturase)